MLLSVQSTNFLVLVPYTCKSNDLAKKIMKAETCYFLMCSQLEIWTKHIYTGVFLNKDTV